jgi:pimeloyl-ACP methyl ester carboxylesterase
MKLLLILSLLTALSACGKKTTHTVKSLSNETKNDIQESLRNKHIPSRQEVADGVIQFDDACEEFRKKIPSDWTQGLIEVPENPADENGQKIKVFYYGKIKEGVTPVVFYNGGPTYDSHSSFSILSKAQPISDPNGVISFVYVDQRGNGCSDYYPQGNDEATMKRLSHYGTRGIVADSEAIRKKLLGDKPWIAFGQSYGSFIVHKYAMVSPENLTAAFGHASVITTDGFSRIKNRIRSQTRVLEEYFKVYPSDRIIFKVLGNDLTSSVCFKDEKSELEGCGYDVLDEIPSFIAFRDDWKYLHSWISDMVVNEKMNIEAVGDFVRAFYFSKYRVTENGVKVDYNSKNMASRVIDWVDRDSAPLNATNCRRIRDELLQEKIDISQNVTTECAFFMQWQGKSFDYQAAVKFLEQDKMLITDFKQALENNPGLAFHLYSGELDQTVPKENFVNEVAAVNELPNFHYTHFMGTGHDGFMTEQKVWDDIISTITSQLP